MNIIARIISFLLNPLFVFLPVPFLLMYRLGYDPVYALKWTIFSFAFHILAVLFVFYSVKRRVFSDIDVSKREQRPLLFTAISIIILVYTVGLYLFHAPLILYGIVIGALIGIIFAYAVNLKIKASLHIAVLTTVLIIITKAYDLTYGILLLIPLVTWSRIKLKRHTLEESIAGFILGICLSLFTFLVLQYLHIYLL